MSAIRRRVDTADRTLIARYVINGIVATAAHFSVLTFNLKVMKIPSAGIANLIAAIVGILVSFTGSRYFVFRAHEKSIYAQFVRFSLLYACIALLHACVLFGWTDLAGLDYRTGFLLATGFQVVLSFWGNKHLVFK